MNFEFVSLIKLFFLIHKEYIFYIVIPCHGLFLETIFLSDSEFSTNSILLSFTHFCSKAESLKSSHSTNSPSSSGLPSEVSSLIGLELHNTSG